MTIKMKELVIAVGLCFAAAVPAQAALPSTWTYHRIFSPSAIPAPAVGTQVKAVYSPSVVKVAGVYHMFFGVSVSCQGGTVARDSIAHATSPDGINNWAFDRYILAPSSDTCNLPPSSWYNGLLYQVNDPTVIFQGNYFYVTYTAVKRNDPVVGQECGRLGTAIFDSALNLVYRNDDYLVGGCAPQYGFLGFSRPTYRQTGQGAYELWYDSGYKVGKIHVSNVNTLSATNATMVYDSGGVDFLLGGDIDVFDGNGVTYVLRNGTTAIEISGAFGAFSALTSLSGQTSPAWDNSGQGSANLFVDTANCAANVYLSGTVLSGGNITLNIGVAIPRDGDIFYNVCNTKRAMNP